MHLAIQFARGSFFALAGFSNRNGRAGVGVVVNSVGYFEEDGAMKRKLILDSLVFLFPP